MPTHPRSHCGRMSSEGPSDRSYGAMATRLRAGAVFQLAATIQESRLLLMVYTSAAFDVWGTGRHLARRI